MLAPSDHLTPETGRHQSRAPTPAHFRSRLMLRPDLDEDRLEDRLTPVIANLGLIALTTGGYMLMTPFPGAFVSPSGSIFAPGPSTSSGVSGTPYNLPFFVMGGGGISSAIPGNITGVPSLGAAGPAASTGPAPEIDVGSGSNDAGAPVIPPITRNTIANDQLNPRPLIGGQPDVTAPLLPPAPAPPAPASTLPPTSDSPGGPTMPPPGSSLKGPFVRWPSMSSGGFPAPAPAMPLPLPGGGPNR